MSDPIRACHDSACVEVLADHGSVLLRSTNDREAFVQISTDEWVRFLAAVKAGRFDEVTDA
jgi:hypothetical protein